MPHHKQLSKTILHSHKNFFLLPAVKYLDKIRPIFFPIAGIVSIRPIFFPIDGIVSILMPLILPKVSHEYIFTS